jgi:hypothetical protein
LDNTKVIKRETTAEAVPENISWWAITPDPGKLCPVYG